MDRLLIRDKSLEDKLVDAEEAVKLFPRKGVIAFGGMAGTAYPKLIPAALAGRVSAETSSDFEFVVISGGSATSDFDQYLARINMRRRYPFGASSTEHRKKVNSRDFAVADSWLFEHSRWIGTGLYSRKLGQIDIAVVEITGVREDGQIIPSLSIDASASLLAAAKMVVFELNTTRPDLDGLHDVFLPKMGEPTPIRGVLDRIGSTGYRLERSRIGGIVPCDLDDSEAMHYSGIGESDSRIIENLIAFLIKEVEEDPNLKSEYVTLQPGAGPIASALGTRIGDVPMALSIWGEVAPTSWLPMLSKNLKGISAAVAYTLPGERRYRKMLYDEIREIAPKLVLRPYEITNSSEMITRFYHIVVQQAIEVDIYGHVNVSHIGNNLYGGVGGSGDHTRNAYLTIIAMPSTTSSQGTSRIVPFVTHTDIPEHDVDVLVTEWGTADLRGLSPTERAETIVSRCTHPKFKDGLHQYLDRIEAQPGHQPVDFEEGLKFRESA